MDNLRKHLNKYTVESGYLVVAKRTKIITSYGVYDQSSHLRSPEYVLTQF
jgi:hypothetical protein